MGIFATMLNWTSAGAEGAARTIPEAEAALARLAAARSEAVAKIADGRDRRRALLLRDDSDDEIEKIELEAERARRTIERLDEAEPLFLARLQELRDEARRAEWGRRREIFMTTQIDLLSIMRAFLEGHDRLTEQRGAAMAAGFTAEAASAMPPTPIVITRDAFNLFEAEIDRQRNAMQSKPAPPPRPAAPPPAPKSAAAPASAKPAKPAPPKPAAPPPSKPFDPTPGEDGLFRVRVLKPGFQRPDGAQAKLNEVVALPRDEAFAVVQRAVGEFEEFLR